MAHPHHHPPDELLLTLATGHIEAVRRITVEAHAAFCAQCRSAVASLSVAGGALLEGADDLPVSDASFAMLETRLDALEPEDEAPPFAAPPPFLPPGLRGLLPPRLYGRRWRRMPLSSARYTVVERDSERDVTLLLLRLDAGHVLPRHEHGGWEDVVVLEGAFRDQQGLFERGDFQLNEKGTRHAPRVQPGAPCWILTAFSEKVRFTGVRGLLQNWTG